MTLGGVVLPFATLEEGHDHKWERILNLEQGAIAQLIWNHENVRRAGTGEMSFLEFQSWDGKELRLSSDQLKEWHEDMWALVEFDGSIAAWIRVLRKSMKVAFLSNAWSDDRKELSERFALEDLADLIIISGEEGVSKPNPRIYELTLERLGLAPEQTVFVDDRPENVEAAVRLGMNGVLRQTTEQMMRDVNALTTILYS
ncbi:MAG: HAD family hydrolase [Actinomycetota bacterium]